MSSAPPRPFRVTHHGDTEDTEKDRMTYVITEPCINVKDASCVAVCPVAGRL